MGTLSKRGLCMVTGMLLIAGTCALSAHAQIARPSTTPSPITTPAMPVAAQNLQTAAPQAPSRPSANPALPQEMLYYVCGSRGLDTHVTSPDPQHPFNLGVSFVSASTGAPLNEVSVKLRRHGRVLMDFVAAGPYCLFSVPEADYRVEGTYRGEMKFEIVQTGNMNAQIKW